MFSSKHLVTSSFSSKSETVPSSLPSFPWLSSLSSLEDPCKFVNWNLEKLRTPVCFKNDLIHPEMAKCIQGTYMYPGGRYLDNSSRKWDWRLLWCKVCTAITPCWCKLLKCWSKRINYSPCLLNTKLDPPNLLFSWHFYPQIPVALSLIFWQCPLMVVLLNFFL